MKLSKPYLLNLMLICLALALSPAFVFSQEISINPTTTDTLYAYNFYLPSHSLKNIYSINSKSNRLYTGIDNKIFFNNNGVSNDSIIIECSNGFVYEDDGDFYCHPTRSGRARIAIYGLTLTNDTIDTFQLAYNDFIVQSLPGPSVKIGQTVIRDLQPVQKRFFIWNDSLSIHYSEDIIGSDEWFEVIGFSFGYTLSGFYKSFNNSGNIITESNKEIIYRLRPGTEISLKIKVKNPDDITINLPVVRMQIF